MATCVVLMTMGIGIGAQAPSPPAPPQGQRPAGPGASGRRGAIAVMSLSTSAWPDGGRIPERYTQTGAQVSPPLAWSQVPDGIVSFVLIARDADAAIGPGTDDVLHWMLWNIPGSARSLPENVPGDAQLADGTRQISVSGPYYRGPGAPASGPPHHYLFELYALDTMLDVPAVGQSPQATRTAVLAAMAGRVRAKGVYVGLFKRGGESDR
jgi:Raf kinase inhibitor-like YbhB/YbcL family protein